MTAAITPTLLAQTLRTATDWLGVYREQINALNVYPVPDGDTGTNMHATMRSVLGELEKLSAEQRESMTEVTGAIRRGALLGARGNSGVILSQLLRGFADTVQGARSIDAPLLREALAQAGAAGYRAVVQPVEGTILTVARKLAEGAHGETVLEVFESSLRAGEEALERTREQLPALRAAGVVDSGGSGYLQLLRGMLAGLRGDALPEAPVIKESAAAAQPHQEFGYCTEFLLENARTGAAELRELLAPHGDSLLVVEAQGLVKGHIHTADPDTLLTLVGRHGDMLRTKVEDMSAQHAGLMEAHGEGEFGERPRAGLLAVSSGAGLGAHFRALGVRTVSGGQSANPSVQDILDAARSVAADSVLILPNNRNVVMAAERAAELLPGAVVLPTRTLGQGAGAALAFSPDLPAGEQLPALQAAAEAVLTFEVTRASRDAEVNGLRVQEGDTIGLQDGELVHAGGDAAGALLAMLAGHREREVLSVFTGPDFGADAAAALEAALATRHPDLEAEVLPGAPELYTLLALLE